VKGTSVGTITDTNGEYSLEAPAGAVLAFSFVGYVTQEFTFNGQTTVNITLAEESTELTEVIVTGYSSVQKRDITGVVSSIKGDAVRDQSINALTSTAGAGTGSASGAIFRHAGWRCGGAHPCSTSINASNRPLYIIDGVPIQVGALSQRDFGGQDDNALSLINPGDIESYQILSDASAKAMYGSRAANGVVIVTTKRGKQKKAAITFDVQRGMIDMVKKLDLLNSTQLLELQREAVRNAGKNPDGLGLIPSNRCGKHQLAGCRAPNRYHAAIPDVRFRRGRCHNVLYQRQLSR